MRSGVEIRAVSRENNIRRAVMDALAVLAPMSEPLRKFDISLAFYTSDVACSVACGPVAGKWIELDLQAERLSDHLLRHAREPADTDPKKYNQSQLRCLI